MAILCRELGLLFILTPATRSTAVGQLLVERFGGEWLPAEDRPEIRTKHSTLHELMAHGLVSEAMRRELLVVTCVRNPYDRLVSIYVKRRGAPPDRVADPESWLYGPKGLGRAADVEWIAEHDFRQWIRRRFVRNWLLRTLLGRSRSVYDRFVDGMPCEIPRINVCLARDARDYREEYDRLTRLLVRIGQHEDLARFGYSF
jgi:Sulfotransferase family